MLGEGNFGKVWKAEVDDICGYEGTILVAVKGVKASLKNKQTQTRTKHTNTKSVNTTAFYLSLPWELRQLMIMFVKSIL